ncbi:bifunctional diguanylate cyclase/phosphodiesterase [Paraglaciecola sp. L1A13]|uniref:putative bifunctional diguanylate cyclase/phosphodiesterase n=1 Tax=Paraglaciecola sp. L1A13 TaxID=2686359 RepID=UPI00131D9918|nr:bifunctional diguanylate cyclase/phosphodiesterase [Paraglaciecola sp. L1A13]
MNQDVKRKTKTQALIYLLKSCWMAPLASKEATAKFRRSQFLAVLQVVPLASLATYLIIALAFFTTSEIVPPPTFIIWACGLTLIASYNLMLWRRFILHRQWARYGVVTHYILIFNLSLAALLYGYLSLQLFSLLADNQRILLVAIIAAFSATGCWMFASIPLAGLLWSMLLSGVFGMGILTTSSDFTFLGYLAIGYSLFLCATVLITSNRFIHALVTRKKMRQQSELISLLLNDFEENANDWLWEIDSQARIQHVSIHLINATGKSAHELAQHDFIAILASIIDTSIETAPSDLHKLRQRLALAVPFNDLRIRVQIQGETRWWAFTGKPLLQNRQSTNGWRGITTDVTEQHQRELEMVRLANEDSLTGLANRYRFIKELNTIALSINNPQPCFVMMLDIDNFKHVNDSMGHHVGDQLLCVIARRLTNILPSDAVLARLGGDEFAILITQNVTQQWARKFSHLIQIVLAEPTILSAHSLDIRVSIGISFAPQNANTVEELLKTADMALYHAKEEGRNRVCVFTSTLKEKSLHKQQLLNDLKTAIKKQQFFLMYQPQFDLQTSQLVSFEALVRWQHPTLGLVSPDEFISLAECSQLIIELGAWVLEQACLDCMQWPASISVAVNVSGVQLENSNLAETVNTILENTTLPHHRLELELTESSIMSNSSKILTMLSNFRLAGGRVAIDDFGTGFSSFSYLHDFPLDKLKIDRSFINLLDAGIPGDKAHAIVHSIIQLGKTLKLQITAEGIETQEQYRQLQLLHCDLGQGFLMARPLDAQQVLNFIADYQVKAS